MISEKLKNLIINEDCNAYFDEPMSLHTSFRIGGKTDCFCEVNTIESLKKIIALCKEENTEYFIIGLGSNLLVSDAGMDGIVIKLGGDFEEIALDGDNIIKCGAGVSLAKLCLFAKNKGLGGAEFAWGIPGSVGGAVYMNAGAYGGEMKDIVVSSRYLDENGNIHEMLGDMHEFSYRHSFYSDKSFTILDVCVKLSPKNKNEIFYLMQDTMDKRKKKQPLNRPSAGSVFKRPKDNYAAALIENCGLKGVSVGDAQVSEKHSGFIVNNGKAKAEDVKALISKVQSVVKEKTGVELECEVKFVGK